MIEKSKSDDIKWLEVFQDWEKSRLTIPNFCAVNKYNLGCFSRKRSEYISKGLVNSCKHDAPCHRKSRKNEKQLNSPRVSFLPVSQIPSSEALDKPSTFPEKNNGATHESAGSENQMLEISLPNGILLRIPTNASY